MIQTAGLTIAALKKEPFSGSYHGMRYYLKKTDEGISTFIYPEPWCFEQTPEESKTKKIFPFEQSGLDEAVAWIEEMWTKDRTEWQKLEKNKMQILLEGR